MHRDEDAEKIQNLKSPHHGGRSEEDLRGQDQKLLTTEVGGGTRSRSRSKADRSGRRVYAESRGGKHLLQPGTYS